MRKYICSVLMFLFLLAFLPPICVQAAGRDGIGVDERGTVTVFSQHAAKERISSLAFGLLVESADAVRVEFQFEESRAEILEFRYDETAKRLNIYVAGTEALFAEGTDSLMIGRILVLDENGGETAANVSVVADSLQYVYGTELMTMEEIELPGVVRIGAGNETPPAETPPVETQEPPENPPAAETQEPPENPPAAETPKPTVTQVPPAPKPSAATQTPAAPRPSASAQIPEASQSPEATQVPDETQTPESAPAETPIPSSEPENTDSAGDGSQASGGVSGMGEDAEQMTDGEEESQRINAVWLIVIIVVIVILAAAGVMAFITWKKKQKEFENQDEE